ncbi:ATP-dependent RNA helicase DDX42-like [Apostichopus japonicus]|uniref:ATP-dependent RNA helicase DDX42-like n=1 Tax=Stichopus japonicus TaxID=307972 RepID=UPI003AB48D82
MSYSRGGSSSRGMGYSGFSFYNRSKPRGMPYGGTVMGFEEPDLKIIMKKNRTEQEYFDADSDEEDASTSKHGRKRDDESEEEEEVEEDPLDAFMAGLNEEAAKAIQEVTEPAEKKTIEDKKEKATRQDIDEMDDQESYFKYMEENPTAGLLVPEDEEIVEYDEEGYPVFIERSKIIDPLPELDHSQINYEDFSKNFYEEHSEISSMSFFDVVNLRKKLGIKVSGIDPPKPVSSFGHFGFDDQLMRCIRKSEFSSPTPIQAQGVPIALSGRDIIGIAKTGSGKTAAFVWPLLVHIMDQREIEKGEGPIGLICAPTRELAQQINMEVKKFGKAYNIHSACCFGGGNMWEQQKACAEGPEVVVCTPGRLIDLVKKKSVSLERVTYLVIDEADRMFDMGFEPQVRSIADHVRPDRLTLLFSATFRKKVERLARDILTDPVRVVQGDIGEANQDVTQVIEILPTQAEKWTWLLQRLVGFTSAGSVLIFVTKKINAEELTSNLKVNDFKVGLLHGDMDQYDRNNIIGAFKKREIPIMVATDVAARGLDIPSIKNVVNYDVARDIDTHTHRIGRTGRAGEKGTAYTLIVKKDVYFAGDLVRNLEGANQQVPKRLVDLAMENPGFRKSRYKAGKAKKKNKDGRGLGYRERPGLGSTDTSDYTTEIAESLPESSQTETPDADKSGFLGAEDPTQGVSSLYSSRLAAMKNAFSSQYKSHFVAASANPVNNTWASNKLVKQQPSPKSVITPPVPVRRAGDHNKRAFKEPELPKPKSSKKVRKSRWDS